MGERPSPQNITGHTAALDMPIQWQPAPLHMDEWAVLEDEHSEELDKA
jgi:hypothetical protein